MKLYTINGREVNKPINKWLIDWEGKSRSNVQFLTKVFLKKFWQYDIVTEEQIIPGSRLSCDFLNHSRKCAIEVDGNFHSKFSPYHHKNRMGFLGSIKRDSAKDNWIVNLMKYQLIRIGEDDVKNLSPKWIKDNFDIDLI